MTARGLHFVVPGPLDQRTGGYLYDARVVRGLRDLGWSVDVHELEGTFPAGDRGARDALSEALESLRDGSTVVIDGLAMGALPGPVRAHGNRLRIVSLVHHPLADETGVGADRARELEALEAEALAACSGVIVTSAFTARRLADYGVPAERIRAVPPGTEPPPLATGGRADGPPTLVCVASVTPRKGHDVLVEALERLADLSWSCVCAGSLDMAPEHAGSVLEEVQRAGLQARIDFVGERDPAELDELYAGASLIVLASHYEGYGMALAEALARGLPVVSTTGGAIPHTVPAGAGLLVEPGDADELAAALRTVLIDAGARDAMAAAARRHAADLPGWPESVAAFAGAIEALTAAPAPVSGSAVGSTT